MSDRKGKVTVELEEISLADRELAKDARIAELEGLLRETRPCVNNDISGSNRFGLLARIDAALKQEAKAGE